MRVSGFSIVRNGVRFQYPFLESYRSILPWVDELVINVGVGDDETLAILEKFQRDEGKGKIVLFQSEWPLNDPEKKRSGKILSEQTNLALDRCQYDWCFYIQADEVFHEKGGISLRRSLDEMGRIQGCDGLVFDYVHFYGSFDYIQVSRSAYRREIRVIRKSSGARSIGDAQSFRKNGNQKLTCLPANAQIFHYGWVRSPEAMKEKTFFMDQLYHGDPTQSQKATQTPHSGENYRYKRILGLRKFEGTHPKEMIQRIQEKQWKWDYSGSPLVWNYRDIKKIVLDSFERLTGIRLFEFKSYRWWAE